MMPHDWPKTKGQSSSRLPFREIFEIAFLVSIFILIFVFLRFFPDRSSQNNLDLIGTAVHDHDPCCCCLDGRTYHLLYVRPSPSGRWCLGRLPRFTNQARPHQMTMTSQAERPIIAARSRPRGVPDLDPFIFGISLSLPLAICHLVTVSRLGNVRFSPSPCWN